MIIEQQNALPFASGFGQVGGVRQGCGAVLDGRKRTLQAGMQVLKRCKIVLLIR